MSSSKAFKWNNFTNNFVIFFYVITCFLSIIIWLEGADIKGADAPDYLSAAQVFHEQGRFYTRNNYYLQSEFELDPPLTDFTPGVSFLTSLLFYFNGEVLQAAYIYEILALSLLFLTLFKISSLLEFSIFSRILLSLVIFLSTFAGGLDVFSSENTFMFVSLALLYFVLKNVSLQDSSLKKTFDSKIGFFLFLCSTIKYMGVFNLGFLTYPILGKPKDWFFNLKRINLKNLALYTLSASFFFIYWRLRNSLLTGNLGTSHGFLQHFNYNKIFDPFIVIWGVIGSNAFWSSFNSVLILLILYLPFSRFNKFKDTLRFQYHYTLVIGTLVQLFGLYLASLLAKFDGLSGRLLSIDIFLFIIILINSIEIIRENVKTKRFKTIQISLSAILALLFFNFDFKYSHSKEIYSYLSRLFSEGKIVRFYELPEKKLWDELREKPEVKIASHYLSSERDRGHFLYSKKVQVPYFKHSFQDEEFINKKLQRKGGYCPFMVYLDDMKIIPAFQERFIVKRYGKWRFLFQKSCYNEAQKMLKANA